MTARREREGGRARGRGGVGGGATRRYERVPTARHAVEVLESTVIATGGSSEEVFETLRAPVGVVFGEPAQHA